MWELHYKESWALKNWCFWTVVLEKILDSLLDCKEIKPVGNQSWIFTRRTDADAEDPILWPPDAKSSFIWMTQDKMAGWHHQLNGHEFEQALGDGEGQFPVKDSLVCCSPWGRKESDMTEQLNNPCTYPPLCFHEISMKRKSTPSSIHTSVSRPKEYIVNAFSFPNSARIYFSLTYS